VFGEGTYSLLSSETLTPVKSSDVGTLFAELPESDRRAWRKALRPYEAFGDYTVLAPNDGSPLAFYAVHKQTGDLAAIMPDGSGGAREELEANLRYVEGMIDSMSLFYSSINGFGVWAALEKTKARLVTRASILLATGESPEGFDDIMGGLACDLAREAVSSAVPGAAGDAVGRLLTVEGYLSLINDLSGLDLTVPCP